MRMHIKPLSVNEAWKGRRFKTDKYKNYQSSVLFMLPNIEVPRGEIEILITFGFSSKASDFDNPVKPFVDCLQKKYGFNDKMIKRAVIMVDNVKKGEEYIEFKISDYTRG